MKTELTEKEKVFISLRVNIRKLAREWTATLKEERDRIAETSSEDLAVHFMECLSEFILPPASIKPRREAGACMTDEEAKSFENKSFPYGQMKGKKVGIVLEADPVYLDALIHRTEKDKFMVDLKRYVQVSWVAKAIQDAIDRGM